jgi:phospholipase C
MWTKRAGQSPNANGEASELNTYDLGNCLQFIPVTKMKIVTRTILTTLFLVVTICIGTSMAQAQHSDPSIPPGLEKIEHFIFIMQENRAFDTYFGTYPGADGIPPGVCLQDPVSGSCVARTTIPTT